MAVEDALHELEAETNAEISWAFGDVLRLWATRDNWRTCLLLQHLETNHRNLTAWNELVRKTRLALANDADGYTLRWFTHFYAQPSRFDSSLAY